MAEWQTRTTQNRVGKLMRVRLPPRALIILLMDRDKEFLIKNYLRKKFNPEVILLAGSRANGLSNNQSDWDIFLFCNKRYPNRLLKYKGMVLDIIFCGWPKENLYLDTQYGPIFPTKILYDSSGGKLLKMLKNTKQAYEKGPLLMQREYCDVKFESVERWQQKLKKYQKEKEIQFYYAGRMYEIFLQMWFEQQNLWPLAPAQALAQIKKKDKKFWELLNEFILKPGKRRVVIAIMTVKKLHSFQTATKKKL